MAPVDKSRAAGISSSSFFDLKAELAKQEEDYAKNKAAGKSRAIIGGVKRPDKKPTIWARQNKGVKSRSARDIELEEISKPTLESARAALERKSLIYAKLRKGKSGGLSEQQYDSLLVDFDSKPSDSHFESDSDDVDESVTVPRAPPDEEGDPIIEYEDEFGRVRSARRSEVPRNLMPRDEPEVPDDEEGVIRNPVNYFPVYEPSAERVAAIHEAHSEANNPLNVHYDSTREVRAKGAGFYQFSGDEERRRQEMEELKSARVETEKTRQETGAIDLRVGEEEGLQGESNDPNVGKSRAMEKRKRELEERRRLIELKRRKTRGDLPPASKEETLHGDGGREVPPAQPTVDKPPDVRAAPESRTPKKEKKKEKSNIDLDPADAFLAQFEKEILGAQKQ